MEFAISIVQRLQQAGYEALFAGGCVRDQLMGRIPKDYDVATSAHPDQICDLFGRHRTIAIGASFGVITVVGPKTAGQVEVATFRRDIGYSDGRRPDRVEYTDAREDALRRDFTINGLFFDPVRDRVLDFVEGRRDLEERVVRAIGNPAERIQEDKLRMLRGVRFTSTFSFELDKSTQEAIRHSAHELPLVSGERIAAEMRRMLTNAQRASAVQLLRDCHLMPYLIAGGEREYLNQANWRTRLKWLQALGPETRFETAVVAWLANLLNEQGVEPLAERWKLSVQERRSIQWIHGHWLMLPRGSSLPWSALQPHLIHDDAAAALQLAAAAMGGTHPGIEFCHQRLGWDPERLNPRPLINGDELKSLGLSPGPHFAKIISEIRNRQLDGEIKTPEQARQIALELALGLE